MTHSQEGRPLSAVPSRRLPRRGPGNGGQNKTSTEFDFQEAIVVGRHEPLV